jgi:hypothetical protein
MGRKNKERKGKHHQLIYWPKVAESCEGFNLIKDQKHTPPFHFLNICGLALTLLGLTTSNIPSKRQSVHPQAF